MLHLHRLVHHPEGQSNLRHFSIITSTATGHSYSPTKERGQRGARNWFLVTSQLDPPAACCSSNLSLSMTLTLFIETDHLFTLWVTTSYYHFI